MKRCILWILVIQLVIGPIEGLAKIVPKEGTEKVTIKKGDTLWELARRYFNDPTKWPEFNKFNKITDPNLIHPGEKIGIGIEEVVMERREAESLLVRIRQEKKKARASLEERDKMIEKAILELKTPLSCDVEDLIIEMKIKIDDLEGILSKQKDGFAEKEKEIWVLKRERDELKDKVGLLNSVIAELTKKLSEAEDKALSQEMEIAGLKKENEKLKKEKREIKTFAYFLTAGAIAGLAIMASSD
ncbi:MAG: LysM peptidoglycan-binding domain-containing protein [bacterium]|nr:LysM peptidoglycan-binding domain-containing protein [bacterium]